MAVSSFKRIAAGSSSSGSTVSQGALYAENANTIYYLEASLASGGYSISNTNGALLSVSFVSNGTAILSTSGTDTSISINLTSDVDTIVFSSDAADQTFGFTYAGPSGGTLATTSVTTITSTQSVTIDKPTYAVLLGGGGAGGNVASANNTTSYRAGGGGGSGYVAKTFLTPGTYTATIGGQGGTTSIAGVTANGGSSGSSATSSDAQQQAGVGGAGGSGGGGGATTNFDSGKGGKDGASGNVGRYGNVNQTVAGGTGSGTTLRSGLAGVFPTNNVSSNTSYEGGDGGTANFGSGNTYGTAGNTKAGYGSGGNGARAYASSNSPRTASGGAGASGVIWLLEVSV